MTTIDHTRESAADQRLVGAPGEPRDARLYRRVCFIRRFEETLLNLFEEGFLTGTTHA
jgi:acetoin:2,6-dichlorophenolindophenol oxidoreductase subunit alpha